MLISPRAATKRPPMSSMASLLRLGGLVRRWVLALVRTQGHRLQGLTYPFVLGPVERAVRGRVAPGTTIHAVSRGSPFTVEKFDERGVVILPGGGRARTRLSWYCLEGMPAFLKDRGWVLVGRTSSSESDLGTLGEYLSTCGMGGSAYRVAAVLQAAGVVESEQTHPLRVRLRG